MLEKVKEVKETILFLSKKAVERKILDEKTYKEIEDTLQKEKIRVAIVGQVKAGKSTFTNAYIFGKNVLPVASSPMTAALSYITEGDSPKAEVEFFSQQEWKKLEETAREDSDEIVVKAAKEIVEEAKKIGSEINKLLGSKKEINIRDISNYVGSEGRYTPITKSITIYLPHEVLKGVDIIDTPGTNDPVVSRAQRTLEFLKEADVVFLCTYAGRPFDTADLDLLNHLKNSAGKVVVVVNKKDMILKEEGSVEKVKKRFKEGLEDLARSIEREGGSSFTVKMIEDAKERIVFFSSLWALIGKMSEKEISADEDLSYYYENFKEEFPQLKKPEDFLRESGLYEIDEQLKEILQKGKFEILVNKPANLLLNAYLDNIKNYKKEISEIETELKSYEYTLSEIKKEREELEKLQKELKGVALNYKNKVTDEIGDTISECINILYQKMNSLSKEVNSKIPEKRLFSSHESYQKECEGIFDNLISNSQRDIEYSINSKIEELRKRVANLINRLFEEIDSLSSKLYISQEPFHQAMIELKREAMDKVNVEFKRDRKFNTSGFWVFGSKSARSEILAKITDQIREFEKKGNEVLNTMRQELFKKFDFIFNPVGGKLFNDIIPVIEEPLKRAEKNYKDQEFRKKELNNKKRELELKLEQLEKEYNDIKQKIERLI